MKIRRAMLFDLNSVSAIYEEIHQAEAAGKCTTGWLRGVYPVRATAEAALQRGDLFVLEDGSRVLGAALINQIQPEAYRGAPWRYEGEVCVLHTLVISPRAQSRGAGRSFVEFYEQYALEHGWYELRIDTNERNTRARDFYARMGYREIGIVPTVFNGIPDVQLVLLEKNLS